MEKLGIVIGSFGTSYEETRKKNIDTLGEEIAAAYPEAEIVHAYTSSIIRGILAKRGTAVFSVTQALEELKNGGVTHVVVQASHLLPGIEYEKLVAEVEAYIGEFRSLRLGVPLLASQKDMEDIVGIINDVFPKKEGTALVLMGHGSSHGANAIYENFNRTAENKGHHHLIMGTVEAEPTIEDIIEVLREQKVEHVILTPFMLVAGDHATNDMASDEEDSWKTLLLKAGYSVEIVLKGLGEYPAVRKIYLEHLAKAQKVEK